MKLQDMKVGQKVVWSYDDGIFGKGEHDGEVIAVYNDHAIVNVFSVCDHMYVDDWNADDYRLK